MSKCSIVVFALTLTLSAAQTFEWFAESPRNCARDPTQCCGSACRGDRDVYCRVRGTNAPISPLFCADTPNPYSSRVDCNETECPRDCVVSEWSSWGACSATCGNLTTEYRSRRVFVPPEAGRSCPDLSQTLDQWSPWSNCSAECYTNSSSSHSYLPYRERTRSVIRTSQFVRTPCPALFERQSCDVDSLPDCPRYEWYNTSWFDCNLDVAGAVFCVLENDPTNTPVGDRFCTGEFLPPGAINTAAPVKPLTTRPCQILCPQDCVTGAWSEWGQCSRSCGEVRVRRLTRPVLKPSLNGGAPCGDLSEAAPCERINCTF
ncbi:thrombospondin type-1 domain-containing protein 7B-like [Oscarella lobularis]|uniref:thrombospondin type-1 domain-containing protein 7B-like n=1 Tax=Oscarella lobularis TaxID=121494 RepID=UPI0033136A29